MKQRPLKQAVVTLLTNEAARRMARYVNPLRPAESWISLADFCRNMTACGHISSTIEWSAAAEIALANATGWASRA